MNFNSQPLDVNEANWDKKEYLTIRITDQLFGIPVLQVQDVLREQPITPIPLAAEEISGSLNLRGRIVTAIDVKKRLGLAANKDQKTTMSVVIEHDNELYSLIIDEVGDVLSLDKKSYEKNPATLDSLWSEIADGIYRLEDCLLVVLDVPKLLSKYLQQQS